MNIISVVSITLIAFIMTGIMRSISLRKNILDIPNHRSSHTQPTPLGGGIAIAIAWYAGITLLCVNKIIPANLYFALLSGIILCIHGFIDDVKEQGFKSKLGFQIVTVLLAMFFLDGTRFINTGFLTFHSSLTGMVFTFFGMLWVINLFNFQDGIDGYAASEAIFIGSSLFILFRFPAGLILSLACLGFLFWNWQQAKIFMGDAGSTFLGFTVGVLGLYLHNTHSATLLDIALLSEVFWFDATLTLWRRFRNKENILIAHRKHAFQRIVQAGFSHQKTVICAMLINMALFVFVYLERRYSWLQLPLAVSSMVLLYAVLLVIDYKKPFEYEFNV